MSGMENEALDFRQDTEISMLEMRKDPRWCFLSFFFFFKYSFNHQMCTMLFANFLCMSLK